VIVTYRGIDRCDYCGQLLEEMQWLVGLCRQCERATKETASKEVPAASGTSLGETCPENRRKWA